jgi:hypothetical protein
MNRRSLVKHRAPECYDGTLLCASDVFAFGLILFELLTGEPVFLESLPTCRIAYIVTMEHARAENSVTAIVRESPFKKLVFKDSSDRHFIIDDAVFFASV